MPMLASRPSHGPLHSQYDKPWDYHVETKPCEFKIKTCPLNILKLARAHRTARV